MTRDELYQVASQVADTLTAAGASQNEAIAITNMAHQFVRLAVAAQRPTASVNTAVDAVAAKALKGK